MKSITLAAALSLAATTAFAGSYVAPVMPVVEVEEASSSSGGFIVPLMVLLVLWAATNRTQIPG